MQEKRKKWKGIWPLWESVVDVGPNQSNKIPAL